MPPGLIEFLQANPNCQRADLFTIGPLPNGQFIYATDGGWDITVPLNTDGWDGGGTYTFSASAYGRWSRGTITSEANFNLQSNTMTLTCKPQPGDQYPGMTGVGILQAAMNGLFDAVSVAVYTCYMPAGSANYGNVAAGIEMKLANTTIMKINKINRTMVEFDVADPLYLCNLKVPTRVIETNCPWSYGDSNCNPRGGVKTQNITVTGASTIYALQVSSPSGNLAGTANYYAQGTALCTAGINSGLTFTIKASTTGGLITLDMPTLVAPANGDTFTITAGCDKSYNTCKAKFGNQNNFGGAPFVPVPVTAF